ncbi:MAG: DUF1592 domain-containing protein [Nannocystaceae bacterium]
MRIADFLRLSRRTACVGLLHTLACNCETGADASDGTNEDGSSAGSTTTQGVAPDTDPGRVTLHRLNRAEYNNTIRDLLGESLDPASEFPAEDPSFGFDNIADVLNISPLQFELYARAAEQVTEAALKIAVVDPVRTHFEAENVFQSTGGECCGGFWNLWSDGTVSATYDAPAKAEYELSFRAFGQQAGDELPHLAVEVDGLLVYEVDVAETEDAPGTYNTVFELGEGSHQVALAFTNDFYDPDNELDRNLLIDWFEIEGPFGAEEGINEMRDQIVICDPTSEGDAPCLRAVLERFVPLAWRRPLKSGELESLEGFLDVAYDHNQGFEAALQMSLTAVLSSPHFLFRVELDEQPDSTEAHLLDDYELASRLAYFLWSSMPDGELFDLAAAGELASKAEIERQVDRMIDDPKSVSLVDNLAGQWLYIRALDNVFKDVYTFPDFDDELRASMRSERELFFRTFLDEDRSMSELLDATDTFVDGRLADFYGIADVSGSEFRRVDISGYPRRGVLTQAGLLTVLAHPATTSPVRRGKWVLDQLLCQPPPPPPADADIASLEPAEGETMKDVLAQHREDPVCASCHNLMDPIGLGFEHYDGIGRWRDTDLGQTIDVSGELPTTGEPFNSATEMAALLAQDEAFPRCTARKVVTYALGRGLFDADEAHLDAIVHTYAAGGYRLRDLIRAVATSDIFRMRRGEAR